MPDPGAIGHRRVLRIALPIVLSNATVPLLGAVDTGVVGQLGLASPLAAVGLGAVVLASIYWVFGFCGWDRGCGHSYPRVGGRGFGRSGSGDRAGVDLAGSMVVGPGQRRGRRPGGPLCGDPYLGGPCLYAVTGWLIASECSRAVLMMQLRMNGGNIALDLWVVLRLGSGGRRGGAGLVDRRVDGTGAWPVAVPRWSDGPGLVQIVRR